MNVNMARLPLYKPISPPDISNNPNTGLLYDKFCDQWEVDWKKGLGTEGKGKWISIFCSSRQYIGKPDLIEEAVERRMELLERCGGLALTFETQGPVVSGLGRSHPVENGFAWHHLLGVPYLPGSSVKGVVRSYATCWLDEEKKVAKADLTRIFGPRDGSIHVGSVIFMDALPIMPVRLKAEIMTPHYAPYYTGTKPEPPGDWFSPVPIPFLAVDEGQEFLFGILPRGPGDEKDCSLASEWLSQALDVMGAGAKTSSGYGRFIKVDLKNRGMRWLARLSRENEDIATFLRDTPRISREEWLKIENPELKCQVAKEMKRLYQEKGLWDRPWGEIKETKRVLEEYFRTVSSCQEGA